MTNEIEVNKILIMQNDVIISQNKLLIALSEKANFNRYIELSEEFMKKEKKLKTNRGKL